MESFEIGAGVVGFPEMIEKGVVMFEILMMIGKDTSGHT